MQDLDIGVLTPQRDKVRNQGKEILELLCTTLPKFTPSRYGIYDPLNKDFDLENLDEVLKDWDKSFSWKSQRLASEGNVCMGDENTHAEIYLSGKSKFIEYKQAVHFFLESCILVEPDFAYIHLFSEEELDAVSEHAEADLYDLVMPFRRGVVIRELRKYIPNLCWGTVLGLPYVKLFGKENILSAPVSIIRELPNGAIYLQLSEKLDDLKKNYQKVDSIRQLAKQHLNHNAFLDPMLGTHHAYNTPEFDLK
jgi:hypothetical protein